MNEQRLHVTRTPILVRYAETDRMGIVYHARYLEWFEMGRVHFLKDVGLPYRQMEEQGRFFPVVAVSVRYRSPATFDDALTLETWIGELSRASVRFDYRLTDDASAHLLAEAQTTHALVGPGRKVLPIPHAMLDKLQAVAPVDRA